MHHDAYHYPSDYQPLSTIYHKWKGLESDEDWNDYCINNVCSSQFTLSLVLRFFISRLLAMKRIIHHLLRTLSLTFLKLLNDVFDNRLGVIFTLYVCSPVS